MNTQGGKNMDKTTFLFEMPNFVSGVGSLLDIFAKNVKFNKSETSELADLRALTSDWDMTGNDILGAMNEYSKKASEK